MDNYPTLPTLFTNPGLAQACTVGSNFSQHDDDLWGHLFTDNEQQSCTYALSLLDNVGPPEDTLLSSGFATTRPLGLELVQPTLDVPATARLLCHTTTQQPTCQPLLWNAPLARAAIPTAGAPKLSNFTASHVRQPPTTRILPKPKAQLCDAHGYEPNSPSRPLRKRAAPDWNVDGVPAFLCSGFQVQIAGTEPSLKKPRRAAKACMRCSLQKLRVSLTFCPVLPSITDQA